MKAFISALILVPFCVFATDIDYQGTSQKKLSTADKNPKFIHLNKGLNLKSVSILKVKLSQKAKSAIAKRQNIKLAANQKNLPTTIQLGMNQVPVLDQGIHGTCATFALTAALDAMRGHEDYYSQLCFLNLGKHMAQNGYSYSGWDGQDPGALLFRAQEFGLVAKSQQQLNGCGGITQYPTLEYDESMAINLSDYHMMSEPLYRSGLSEWRTYFQPVSWLSKDVSMEELVYQTKRAIYHGNRVLISTLLPLFDEGVGAVGKFHKEQDSWVLTGKIEQAAQLYLDEYNAWGAHAMVITGYDDEAVAIDNDGHAHKGLFTLRNSWGREAGDNGDYYMSYDYFMMLVIELNELIKVNPI